MESDTVEIPREKLVALEMDSRKLASLEAAGVSYWSGYGYAMEVLAQMEHKNEDAKA